MERFKIMECEIDNFQKFNQCNLVELQYLSTNNENDFPEVLHEIRCICCNQKLGEVIILINAK